MSLTRRNRRASKGPSARRRMLLWGGVGLFSAYLLFFLVFGRMGLIAHVKLRDEEARIEREIAQTRQEIQVLTRTAERLNRDPQAIERLARERLGMVRPGETVYLFPDADGVPPAGGHPEPRP